MKTTIALLSLVAGLATLSNPARAEEPRLPQNIAAADVCTWSAWSSLLTCKDGGGNILISDARVFDKRHVSSYPVLTMVSQMKRQGFESKASVQNGYETILVFERPVTCR